MTIYTDVRSIIAGMTTMMGRFKDCEPKDVRAWQWCSRPGCHPHFFGGFLYIAKLHVLSLFLSIFPDSLCVCVCVCVSLALAASMRLTLPSADGYRRVENFRFFLLAGDA
jgi:hypothetical protein